MSVNANTAIHHYLSRPCRFTWYRYHMKTSHPADKMVSIKKSTPACAQKSMPINIFWKSESNRIGMKVITINAMYIQHARITECDSLYNNQAMVKLAPESIRVDAKYSPSNSLPQRKKPMADQSEYIQPSTSRTINNQVTSVRSSGTLDRIGMPTCMLRRT